MCGIAGFLARTTADSTRERRAQLLQMSAQLGRRGPDDEQLLLDGPLALAFRRLAIIDVAAGAQPIWNEDRTVCVAVNGEIYNHHELRSRLEGRHTFRTRSDSEVVLHLFEELGPAALGELNGEFAIALWNRENKRLFLARDRLGIKPLYFAAANGTFFFGSEVKAITAHRDAPRELCWADFDPAPGDLPTYVRGIHALHGGEYLVVQDAEIVERRRYWDLQWHVDRPTTSLDADGYREAYAGLLEDSVRLRLRSDVPVGAFLSGGLDSCTIVAAAARAGASLPCFTVIEPNTLQIGDAAAAQQLTRELDLRHHPVLFAPEHMFDALELSLDTFERWIWMMDAPRYELEAVFKSELHRFARASGVRCILAGQGADEFLGGYSRPLGAGDPTWAEYLSSIVAPDLAGLVHRQQRVPERLRGVLASPLGSFGEPSLFHREMLDRTLVLQRYNLWLEDRTSARYGMEVRVPFLDHRLVELAAAIPASLHEALFYDKRMLRQIAGEWLPPGLADRRKGTFFYNYEDTRHFDALKLRLIMGVFPGFRESYLETSDALFDRDELVALFERTQAGMASSEVQDLLISAMATSVFARQLATVGGVHVPALESASPFYEVTDLAAIEARYARSPEVESRWLTSDVPRWTEGARPLQALDDAMSLCLARDGVIELEIELGEDTRWLPVLLARVIADEGATVSTLASELGVPMDDVADVLEELEQQGFIWRQAG